MIMDTRDMWFGLHPSRESAEIFLKDKAFGEWKIVELYHVRSTDVSLPVLAGYLVVPVDLDMVT